MTIGEGISVMGLVALILGAISFYVVRSNRNTATAAVRERKDQVKAEATQEVLIAATRAKGVLQGRAEMKAEQKVDERSLIALEATADATRSIADAAEAAIPDAAKKVSPEHEP